MKINSRALRKLVLSSFFLALGIVLPFLTGQIQHIGNMLLPMHIPVFLCGMLCGGVYGGAVGFILPIMRSVIFTMPLMYPNAIGMAFELCTYGIVSGVMISILKKRNLFSVYVSLILAMLCGRAVWGVAQSVLLFAKGSSFTFKAFLAGAFVNAVPGIIIQILIIPVIITLIWNIQKRRGA